MLQNVYSPQSYTRDPSLPVLCSNLIVVPRAAYAVAIERETRVYRVEGYRGPEKGRCLWQSMRPAGNNRFQEKNDSYLTKFIVPEETVKL